MNVEESEVTTSKEAEVKETEVKETEAKQTETAEPVAAEVTKESRDDFDSDRRKRRKTRHVGEAVFCRPLEVVVRDDRVEQAIRQLKNRMAREGVLRELKNRRHYFKPSELKRIKSREAARRRRKQARQKNGY